MPYPIVCLLTDDFDPALIPPQPVLRSREVCNHTPCPEGYLAKQNWMRQASKTHSQVTCPHCGRWSIWLPKRQAMHIRRKEAKEAREFSKAYLADCERRKKTRRKHA